MFAVLAVGSVVMGASVVLGEGDGLRRRLAEDTSDCVSPDYVLRLEADNYDAKTGNWHDSSGRGNDALDTEVQVEGALTRRGQPSLWTCCKFEGMVSRFVDIDGEDSDGEDETLTERQCDNLCLEDDGCVAVEVVSTDVPIQHRDCDRYHSRNKRYACKLHYQAPGDFNPFLTMQYCKNPKGQWSNCKAKSRHIAQDLAELHWDSPRKATAENGEPVVRFRTRLEDLEIQGAQTDIETGDARTLCFKMGFEAPKTKDFFTEQNNLFGVSSGQMIDFGTFHWNPKYKYYPERLRLRSHKGCGNDDNLFTPKGSVPSGVHTFCIQGDAKRAQIWMDGQVLEKFEEPVFDYSLHGVNIGVGSARFSRKYGMTKDNGFIGDIYEMILYPRWIMDWEVEKIHSHLTRHD